MESFNSNILSSISKPGAQFLLNQTESHLIPALNQDLINRIICYLNGLELFPASLINKFWYKTVSVAKGDFNLKKKIALSLSRNLNEDFHDKEKQKILNLVSQKEFEATIFTLLDFKESIVEILSPLPKNDLELLYGCFFVEFKLGRKPKLFYDLIFTVEKYKRLHRELNLSLMKSKYSQDMVNRMERLLFSGALPTAESLEIVISNYDEFSIKEMIKLLLEFGALPTNKTLNLLIVERRDDKEFEETLDALLKSGAVPTTETLNIACEDLPIQAIENLLKFGALATAKTLENVINSQNSNSDEIIDFLLKNGVVPTLKTLNLALPYSSLQIIQKMLDLGVTPTDETLKIAKKLTSKKASKSALLFHSGSDEHKEIYRLIKTTKKSNKKALKLSKKIH